MAVVKPLPSVDEYQLSLPRMLFLDLPVVVSSLLLAGAWLIGLPALLLGYLPVGVGRIVFTGGEVIVILAIALLITLLAGPLIVMRVVQFRSILAQGVVLHGQVIRRLVTFAEFRVDYVFQHHYQPFQQRNAIRRQRHIEARPSLEPGSVVLVLVHPYLPERSLLIELYRA
ncbi:MAG: hypothetical protein KF753_08785 [Caldilineaceae bacterium]|nr:hypothetical protein [Caldilineaceae bacterium]